MGTCTEVQVSSNAQVLHLVIYFLPIECLRSFKPANFLRYPFRFECYPGMSCSGMQSSPVCGSCLNSEAIVLFADGSFSDPKRSVLLWHILQARSQKAPRLTLNLNLTSLKKEVTSYQCVLHAGHWTHYAAYSGTRTSLSSLFSGLMHLLKFQSSHLSLPLWKENQTLTSGSDNAVLSVWAQTPLFMSSQSKTGRIY